MKGIRKCLGSTEEEDTQLIGDARKRQWHQLGCCASWDRHYSSLECKMEGQSRQKRACVKHELEKDSARNFFKSKLPIPEWTKKVYFQGRDKEWDSTHRSESLYINWGSCIYSWARVWGIGKNRKFKQSVDNQIYIPQRLRITAN